jgi:hypothetical protein
MFVSSTAAETLASAMRKDGNCSPRGAGRFCF